VVHGGEKYRQPILINAEVKAEIDRLTSKIASLLPNLGGVDALIFTGGVGGNHPGIRAAVAAKLAFLGVEIDPVLNSLLMTLDRDLAIDLK
jgi:acetate kinase